MEYKSKQSKRLRVKKKITAIKYIQKNYVFQRFNLETLYRNYFKLSVSKSSKKKI